MGFTGVYVPVHGSGLVFAVSGIKIRVRVDTKSRTELWQELTAGVHCWLSVCAPHLFKSPGGLGKQTLNPGPEPKP